MEDSDFGPRNFCISSVHSEGRKRTEAGNFAPIKPAFAVANLTTVPTHFSIAEDERLKNQTLRQTYVLMKGVHQIVWRDKVR